MKLMFWSGRRPDEDAYVAFCHKKAASVRDSLYRNIQSDKVEIAEVEAKIAQMLVGGSTTLTNAETYEIGRLQARQKQFSVRLQKQRVSHSFLDEASFRERFRNIQKIPRVAKASFRMTRKSEAILEADTEPLFGKSREGTWRRVGRMTITVNVNDQSTESIRFQNHDYVWNGRHAPTQNGSGGSVFCFGTAYTVLDKALSGFDHLTVVKTLVRFAECAGQTNAIANWPEVAIHDVPEWYIRTFGA